MDAHIMRALIPFAALSLVACSAVTDPTEPRESLVEETPSLTTDRSDYEVSTGQIEVAGERIGYIEFIVDLQYVNRSDRPVFLHDCGAGPFMPRRLDRYVNGRWERAYEQIMLTCGAASYRIAPGETYSGEIRVRAFDPQSSVNPQWQPESIDGTYRLNWAHSIFTEPGVGVDEVPLEDRVSNSFQLSGRLPW